VTMFFNVSERVSMGIEDGLEFTTKQSSTADSWGPSVKDLLASMPLYGDGPLVGIPPSLTGR
jgi:hypothetical protein